MAGRSEGSDVAARREEEQRPEIDAISSHREAGRARGHGARKLRVLVDEPPRSIPADADDADAASDFQQFDLTFYLAQIEDAPTPALEADEGRARRVAARERDRE